MAQKGWQTCFNLYISQVTLGDCMWPVLSRKNGSIIIISSSSSINMSVVVIIIYIYLEGVRWCSIRVTEWKVVVVWEEGGWVKQTQNLDPIARCPCPVWN